MQVLLIRSYQLLLKGLARVLPFPRQHRLIGAGSSQTLAAELSRRHWRRPLLVSDRQLMQLQLPAALIRDLEATGLPCSVFDQVLENPTIACVEAGLQCYRRNGCDSLIAVGGGSVMDCAKGIAARVGNPWLPLRWMEGLFRVLAPPPPLACLPTTAGSGSESTIAAVFTDPQRHGKFAIADLKLLPRIMVIDPMLMLGLPPAITAASGMDALTHAVESYIGRNGSAWSRRKALSALRRIHRWLLQAHRHGRDESARLQMALAAHEAGAAFTRTNVGYAHAIAHALGSLYGLPHGLANAIVLPEVLRWSHPCCEQQLAEMARAIELEGSDGSEQGLALAFIAWIEALKQDLGIPATVAELREEHIPQISRSALKEAHPGYPVPRLMTQTDCEALVSRLQDHSDNCFR